MNFLFPVRPVKPTKLKDLEAKQCMEPPKLVMDKDKLPLVTRLKMEKVLESMKSAKSTGSIYEHQSTIPKILGVNNNADYPTISDVYHTISFPQSRVAEIYNPEKRLSVPLIPDEDKPKGAIAQGKASHLANAFNNRRGSEKRQRTFSDSRTKSHKGPLAEINRPLYRDDIFFGASLTRLPQYTSRTSVAYNLSVTRLPTKTDIEEEKERKCKICPEAFRRALATMLDFSLLKSPSFLLLAIGGAFTMMGFYVPFMYLSHRAQANGIDERTAIWLVSAIGIANTVGRVLCGVLSSFPGVNALLVNNAALTIGGLATIFSGFSLSEEYQFTYSVVFGLSICKYPFFCCFTTRRRCSKHIRVYTYSYRMWKTTEPRHRSKSSI